MSENGRCWALQHAEINGDFATCKICDLKIICSKGKHRRLIKHLKNSHHLKARNSTRVLEQNGFYNKGINNRSSNSSHAMFNANMTAPCFKERTDEINMALAKMLIINQLPKSFCDSEGFRQFAATLFPGYTPITEVEMREKIIRLYDKVAQQIKHELQEANNVALVWKKPHILASFIDQHWMLKTFILGFGGNSGELLLSQKSIFVNTKVYGIVTEDENFSNTKTGLMCAAKIIDNIVNGELRKVNLNHLIQKSNKLANYFRTSPRARQQLRVKKEFEFAEIPQRGLLLSRGLEWNLMFKMLERLVESREPITEVLSDRSVIGKETANSLKIDDLDWSKLEEIKNILYTVSTLVELLSAKEATYSMVRPMVQAWIDKCLQPINGESAQSSILKEFLIKATINRFELQTTNTVTTAMIASFLDPRSKDLMHEATEMREKIRQYVKDMLKAASDKQVADADDTNIKVPKLGEHEPNKFQLFFEFKRNSNSDFEEEQWSRYLDENQLAYDMNPFDWWHRQQAKFPNIAKMAKNYLCIPATTNAANSVAEAVEITCKKCGAGRHSAHKMAFLRENLKYLN